MSRIAAIFQNNRVYLMTVATSKEYILEHYDIVTFINKPLNPYYTSRVLRYFDQHPERLLQHYLK